MLVGATEDSAQQPSLVLAKAQMDMAKLTGLNAVRFSANWDRGQTAPLPDAVGRLQNAVAAASLDHIRPILSLYPRGSSQTPDRQQAAAHSRVAQPVAKRAWSRSGATRRSA